MILAINEGTASRPDYWLLSANEFDAAELAPYRDAMRAYHIVELPEGTPARWSKLRSKEDVMAALRKRQGNTMTRAWRAQVAGYDDVIINATTRGQAHATALRFAHSAGLTLRWADVRVTRAPEHDKDGAQ